MTFESPHFVENGGAQNNAIDLRLVYSSLAGRGASGVAFGGDLAVSEKGTPDMSVDIAAGAAFVASTRSDNQGTYHAYNNATINQAISAADPTDPRIDRVCVQIRDEAQDAGLTQNDVRIFVEEGTPAAVPSAPSVSIEDYVELAQVTVPAGASSITNSDISDVRKVLRPNQQVFTASGNFAKGDYPGLRAVRVRVVGGGGGGGGSGNTASGEVNAGRGGGGGGYAEGVISAADLSASETVTVGAGGTAGVSGGAAGGSGGGTSFGAHVVAGGGEGGGSNFSSTSGGFFTADGGGGVGTSGDILAAGAAGGAAVPLDTSNGVLGGFGGSSYFGGGGEPVSTTGASSSPGRTTITPGGGGSGAATGPSQTGSNGGAGHAGVVIVDILT